MNYEKPLLRNLRTSSLAQYLERISEKFDRCKKGVISKGERVTLALSMLSNFRASERVASQPESV